MKLINLKFGKKDLMVTKVLLSMLSTAQKILLIPLLPQATPATVWIMPEKLKIKGFWGEYDKESVNARFSAFLENNPKLLRAICNNRGV